MGRIHGTTQVNILDGDDISSYGTSSDYDRKADTHDNTTYGNDSHVYDGGLLDGTVKLDGMYDSTASTGPRAVIQPLLGTKVTFIRRPEGTGAGLPQDSMSVVVAGYKESSPVADYIKWSCDMQISGDVDSTPQSS